MARWSSACRNAVIGAGAVMTTLALTVTPASAQVQEYAFPIPPAVDGWGRLLPGEHCAQATAWSFRKKALGGAFDIPVHEVHAPGTDGVPSESGGDSSESATGIFGARTRAMVDQLPRIGKVPCAAYAEANAKDVSFSGPILSLINKKFSIKGSSVLVAPGKELVFGTGLSRDDIAGVAGTGEIPTDLLNVGIRGSLATAMLNEAVTVDASGRPTSGGTGSGYDRRAPGGYINAVHLSLLGGAVKDITIGHSAALIDRRYLPLPECSYTQRCAGGR